MVSLQNPVTQRVALASPSRLPGSLLGFQPIWPFFAVLTKMTGFRCFLN